MKTYEEMAQSALCRIDRIRTEKAGHKRAVVRAILPVGACVAVLLGVVGWRMEWRTEHDLVSIDAPGPASTAEQVSTEAPIGEEPLPTEPNVTRPDDGQKGVDIDPVDGFAWFWWNRLNVSGPLYWALEGHPDAMFSVLATYRPATEQVTDFIYEGKPLAAWAVEAFAENASQTAKEDYKRAYNAYLEVVLPHTVDQLSEKGIRCERAAYLSHGLMLYVTAEELKTLPLADPKNWNFSFMSDAQKGPAEEQTDLTGQWVVN